MKAQEQDPSRAWSTIAKAKNVPSQPSANRRQISNRMGTNGNPWSSWTWVNYPSSYSPDQIRERGWGIAIGSTTPKGRVPIQLASHHISWGLIQFGNCNIPWSPNFTANEQVNQLLAFGQRYECFYPLFILLRPHQHRRSKHCDRQKNEQNQESDCAREWYCQKEGRYWQNQR